MRFIKSDVQFNVDGKQVCFSIIHNMPKIWGHSFEDALDCWLARTRRYTAKSLVNYINSKDTCYTAMTEKQYNRLSKYNK